MKPIDLPSPEFVRRFMPPTTPTPKPTPRPTPNESRKLRRTARGRAELRRRKLPPIIDPPGQRITAGRPRTVWARTAKPFRWPRFRPLATITERIARSAPGTLLDAMALGGTRAAFEALKRAARMGYVEPHHRVRTERGG